MRGELAAYDLNKGMFPRRARRIKSRDLQYIHSFTRHVFPGTPGSAPQGTVRRHGTHGELRASFRKSEVRVRTARSLVFAERSLHTDAGIDLSGCNGSRIERGSRAVVRITISVQLGAPPHECFRSAGSSFDTLYAGTEMKVSRIIRAA